MNVRKIVASSRSADLNFLELIVSLFISALVGASLMARTKTFPVVALVESTLDAADAVLM
jgi:hypothetical protein